MSNTSPTSTFFRGDKAPSPFDVQIVSNLFNNSVWPWVIAGNQDYWAYILSILADWWNSPTSYLAKRVYFCSKCHASFRDSRILLQSFLKLNICEPSIKNAPYAFKYKTRHCNKTRRCLASVHWILADC